LADVTKEFEQLLASELPALNESLKSKGQQPIPAPPAKVVVNEATPAAGAMNSSADADAPVRRSCPPILVYFTDAAGIQETAHRLRQAGRHARFCSTWKF